MTNLKSSHDFEARGWKSSRGGDSSSAHYIMDTVIYHEDKTSAQVRLNYYKKKVYGLTLDMGCNTGGITMALSEKTSEIIGLDFMDYALKVANKVMKELQNKKFDGWCHPPQYSPFCSWICSSATNLPFQNDTFDTIIMGELIEHLPKELRGRTIKEIASCLKPNGTFVISTMLDVHDPTKPEWRAEVEKDVHPFGFATIEDLKQYLEDAGLIICNIETGIYHKIEIIIIEAKK